jgi:hypothetical protein
MLWRWFSGAAKLRVRVETPGPPELGKERFDGDVRISVERPIPSSRIGPFCFAEAERRNSGGCANQKYVP